MIGRGEPAVYASGARFGRYGITAGLSDPARRLMTYGPGVAELYRQEGRLVARILKGTSPAELAHRTAGAVRADREPAGRQSPGPHPPARHPVRRPPFG